MSACARCGYDPEKDRTVQVSAETLVAVFDAWLATDEDGPFHHRVTEKLLIICVRTKRGESCPCSPCSPCSSSR